MGGMARGAEPAVPAKAVLAENVEGAVERHARRLQLARIKSRFMRAITSSLISFGHTASHSPMFVQLPNSSRFTAATMLRMRSWRSGCPCGRTPRCVTFAPVNNDADALGQAATHAPHPIQAAASMAVSAAGLGTGMAFP